MNRGRADRNTSSSNAAVGLRVFSRAVIPILLTCCGAGIGLGLAEIVLRSFKLWAIVDYSQMNWYRKTPIPGVPYLFKPNLRTAWGLGNVITDEFGLRNDRSAPKLKDTYRILLLGDSVTFGFGVDQTQSFPAVLERLLNESSAVKYEVVNAGVPGYNISDEAALLPALFERYRPDLTLWTVVSNDYDDSLGVDDGGRISASNVDYVVNAGHIASWGADGSPYIDVDDFRRSMLPRFRAQAEGREEPKSASSAFDSWLSSHLLVYSFFGNRVNALPKFTRKPESTEAELLGRYTTPDGRSYLMQFFSASYSSRHAIDLANRAIERVRDLSKRTSVPIVLINDGLPIDARWMNSRENIVYQDLSDYLGESPVDFFFRNNLGWDGHPSPSGNRKIAQALGRMLACLGYVREEGRCQGAGKPGGYMRGYWNEFEVRRQRFVERYYGPIDLDRFRGMHQILGGIYPSRVFPGPVARRANVLLPGGHATSVAVSGSLPGKDSVSVRFTVFAATASVTTDEFFKPGENTVAVDLRPLSGAIESSLDPIELQMECVSEKCPPIRLHSIAVN